MLCVIAKLSEEAREKLLYVQNTVESFGLKKRPLYGHITLGTFVEGNEELLMERCRKALRGINPVKVCYEEILELDETYIVVAVLKRSAELLDLQRSVVQGQEELLDRWTHSEIWQPHTTLVHEPGMELKAVRDAMQAVFEPFETVIERVDFSRVTENGYEIIGHVML